MSRFEKAGYGLPNTGLNGLREQMNLRMNQMVTTKSTIGNQVNQLGGPLFNAMYRRVAYVDPRSTGAYTSEAAGGLRANDPLNRHPSSRISAVNTRGVKALQGVTPVSRMINGGMVRYTTAADQQARKKKRTLGRRS